MLPFWRKGYIDSILHTLWKHLFVFCLHRRHISINILLKMISIWKEHILRTLFQNDVHTWENATLLFLFYCLWTC